MPKQDDRKVEGQAVTQIVPAAAEPARGFRARVLAPDAPEREPFERDLLDRGVWLPLWQRRFASGLTGLKEEAFIAVRDASGAAAFGLALSIGFSRALPGHRILYATRIGGASPQAICTGVAAAAQHVRSRSRILRLHMGFFLPESEARSAVARECSRLGFERAAQWLSYRETILLDLRPSADEILAGFRQTARRHIRAVDKKPVALRPILHETHVPSMRGLIEETMARTGGSDDDEPLNELLAISRQRPDLARAVGLFDERPETDDRLLAFAVAYRHGDYVEYSTAASTRDTDLKMPLAYGLAWDLMQWGKNGGARWFDFGGVTRGTHESEDNTGGISDFKRYFSTNIVEVGDEWILEPRPGRAKLAKAVSRCYAFLRSIGGR